MKIRLLLLALLLYYPIFSQLSANEKTEDLLTSKDLRNIQFSITPFHMVASSYFMYAVNFGGGLTFENFKPGHSISVHFVTKYPTKDFGEKENNYSMEFISEGLRNFDFSNFTANYSYDYKSSIGEQYVFNKKRLIHSPQNAERSLVKVRRTNSIRTGYTFRQSTRWLNINADFMYPEQTPFKGSSSEIANGAIPFLKRESTHIIHLGHEWNNRIDSRVKSESGDSKVVHRNRTMSVDLLISPYSAMGRISKINYYNKEIKEDESTILKPQPRYDELSAHYQNGIRRKLLFIPIGLRAGIKWESLFLTPISLGLEAGLNPGYTLKNFGQIDDMYYFQVSFSYLFNKQLK
jgi:hypothetical protein